LNGSCRQWLNRNAGDRRGRELNGSLSAPGWFYLACATSLQSEEGTTFWPIRPTGTSAKNWSRERFGNEVDRGSRRRFEWIARGLTEESFWTASRHWIAGLESRSRFERKQQNSDRLD
jgi:hypothetical protein